MAFTRDPGFGRRFLSIVASVLRRRDSAIRSNASVDSLPFCSVLGCNLTWTSSEFFVLRFDLHAEPLFPTSSPLLSPQDRIRLFASDRPVDRDEHLCRTISGQTRDAFPDSRRIYRRWNRFFLARVCHQ